MKSKWLLLVQLVILLCICERGYGNCAFEGAEQKGSPPQKLNKTTVAFIVEENEACPYYAGKEVCCGEGQIKQMSKNIFILLNLTASDFATINEMFGDCPICAVNIKRFWCEYTCSPNQADFGILSYLYYK